jgi:drug/metabolite transporter (DMT)-like permease
VRSLRWIGAKLSPQRRKTKSAAIDGAESWSCFDEVSRVTGQAKQPTGDSFWEDKVDCFWVGREPGDLSNSAGELVDWQQEPDMETSSHRPVWKSLLAFAIIYFVWGSTFLAIRVGVREVPPFLLAAMRFLVAGLALYGWTIGRGDRSPRGREWASAFLLATLIFVFDYGLLFWAEQRVPSGIAAVMLAMIPVFMALSEIIFLRTQRLTLRLALALLTGIAGVAVLVSRSLNLGGAPIDRLGAVALIFASVSWSVASVLSRKLPLPASKIMSSGAQMLAGGILLTLAAGALGEFKDFHPGSVSREVWLSLLYLIVAGSIIGFTAYVWLIHHESPTKVGTYAYVNPVVAVFVGYFLGGEALGVRTVLGSMFVLISVVVITTAPARKPVVRLAAEETG